jgi:hypothetical protein
MQKSKAIKIKLKITHVVFRSKRTCFMQGSLRPHWWRACIALIIKGICETQVIII